MIDGTSKKCCREEEPCRPDTTPTLNQVEDKIYDIHIHQVDRGYVVQAGCKTFVFEDSDRLLAYLTDYVKNPDAVLKKFYDGTLFFPPTA